MHADPASKDKSRRKEEQNGRLSALAVMSHPFGAELASWG
jgi:hypothetical protein